MSNENKKDFNAMMKNNKDMPKIQIVTDKKQQKSMVAIKCILHRLVFMMS